MKWRAVLLAVALCMAAPAVDGAGGQDAPPTDAAQPTGTLFYEVEDAVGDPMPTTVMLYNPDGTREITAGSAKGRGTVEVRPGTYDMFVYVFPVKPIELGIPFLVHKQTVEIKAEDIVPALVTVTEGIGSRGLDQFDKDWDGTLDRVEIEAGTDPEDPASYPNAIPFPQNGQVINPEEGWYKGELNCQSTYSGGDLTVKQLIREAKARDLDFLAITDARTMQHCLDEDYKSDDVLLIPAYQWGESGHAAVLAPKTYIERWENDGQVWFTIRQVTAQGGAFIIQHPCGPQSPWEWYVWGFHGVEVWQKTWRHYPASMSDIFGKGKYTRGRPIIPAEMASALVAGVGTVNAQALKFAEQFCSEREGVRPAYRIASVGGSGRRVKTDGPLGEPTTFVYAKELSVPGIIDALRSGRSFVAASPDGPRVLFMGDADADGKFDAMMGGMLPLNVPLRFRVLVEGAVKRGRNLKLKIIKNGLLFDVRRPPEGQKDPYQLEFEDTPLERSWYRVDVVEIVDDEKARAGFGFERMLATTSPIYAVGPEYEETMRGITFEHVKTERSGEVVHVLTPPETPRPPLPSEQLE